MNTFKTVTDVGGHFSSSHSAGWGIKNKKKSSGTTDSKLNLHY